MQTCIACSIPKPLSEFYTHPRMANGRLGRCKTCCKEQEAQRRRTNPRVQEYDRKRYQRPERKARSDARAVRWIARNPIGYRAHNALNNALRDGRIKKLPCEKCGTTRNVHAHHEDYRKPLQVTWLCAKDHQRLHHAV